MGSNRMISRALLSALLLSLSACLGTTPPSQFYLLEPVSQTERSGPIKPSADQLVIALAPIRIPKYVDRPQMVTAIGKNAYQLSELNRWAEALDDNIARVLAQDLTVLVPAQVLLPNASSRSKLASLRLQVNVLEFHVDAQGQAGLTVQWTITRGDDMIMSRQTSYAEPASKTDYRAMAESLNGCLNRLSRDLAGALRQLPRAG